MTRPDESTIQSHIGSNGYEDFVHAKAERDDPVAGHEHAKADVSSDQNRSTELMYDGARLNISIPKAGPFKYLLQSPAA